MRRFFLLRRSHTGTRLVLFALLAVFTVSVVWAAVDLAYFEGVWQTDRVVLSFGTGSEVDHTGFHVWRSTHNIPPSQVNENTAVRLTRTLIVGNPCQSVGYDYEYHDTTVTPTTDKYYYYLESVPCSSGNSQFFGAADNVNSGLEVVNPNPGDPASVVYMPLISRKDSTN